MAEEEVAELEPVAPLSDEDFEGRQSLFEEIFAGCAAQDIKMKSLAERKEKEMEGVRSLTYSELDISTVHKLLNIVKDKHGPLFPGKGLFLDIGSGAGKACVAAGLLHPFEKVVGVETLECLNGLAGAANGKYQDAQVPEGVVKPPLEFVKGDFVMEFDSLMEPLAAQTVMCLALSTCYGEEQMSAMAKFADKMPAGSIFITFSQELPESLMIDINKNPKLRRAAAVKKALAVRGKAPEGIEVTVEPAPNNAHGWKKVHSEEVEMMWGMTTCYIFKKYDAPFCDVGELCMVTCEGEDAHPYAAKYVDPTHAIFLDDAFDEPCQVCKMEPFTAEAFEMVLARYKATAAENKKAESADAAAAVAAAIEAVKETVGTLATEDRIGYTQDPEAPNKESQCMVQSLVKGCVPISTTERPLKFMVSKWDEACKEADKEVTGSVSQEEAVEVWNTTKGEYVKLLEDKIAMLEEWQKVHPQPE